MTKPETQKRTVEDMADCLEPVELPDIDVGDLEGFENEQT